MNSEKESTASKDLNSLPIVNQCFIITPIGDVNSEVYTKAMGLIDAVIEPILLEYSFKAVAANHISLPGSINKQLIKSILEDKLVIANLTGLNPNVMYELAIRHAVRLPVVIMAERGTRLPFDITDQRTIFYDDSLSGLNHAREQLRNMIKEALEEKEPDNPIYQAAEQALIIKSLKADDPMKMIIDRLDRLETSLSKSRVNQSRRSKEAVDPSAYQVHGSFVDKTYVETKAFNYMKGIAAGFNGVYLESMAHSSPLRFNFVVESHSEFLNFVLRLEKDSEFLISNVIVP